ncbi:MAG TPA: AarF/ABC1/UbiB kinase family protein [Acidimicrobiales bacterium]|nr:AarF/ABC1/UbiB kinase family protein [Acidimicrobiales bacterium]
MADRWLPTGRVRRAVTPARLIVEGAAAATLAKARAVRGGSLQEIAEDLAEDERLVAAAERIARQLGEMKGAAMKIGQILSFVDLGLVPEQFRGALAALQADAPPMPYELVEQVIVEELGARPEELFDYFSPVPIASASIGQVHMARGVRPGALDLVAARRTDGPALSGRLARGLGSGGDDEELVVKVQYPGVAKAIESDLKNAALLSLLGRVVQRLLADLVGRVDTKAIIEELRERATEELDYRIEARNQELFRELFEGDPTIEVPAVVPELSTERVLTSQYVDGLRWSAALEAPKERRDRWGQVIGRFQWLSMFGHGVTNLDPHPGNYLFHDDGHVTFLDFGACQQYTGEQLERLIGLVLAAMADTDEAVMASLERFGLIRKATGFDVDLLVRPVRLAFEPAMAEEQPFQFTRDFVAVQVAQALDLRFGKDELKLLQALDVPPELPMVLRVTVGIAGLLSQLGAAVDFQVVLDEALAGHPDYTPFSSRR